MKIMAEFHDGVLTGHLPKAPSETQTDRNKGVAVCGLSLRTSSSDAVNRCRRR
jgi:hypothetical protein